MNQPASRMPRSRSGQLTPRTATDPTPTGLALICVHRYPGALPGPEPGGGTQLNRPGRSMVATSP